MSKATIIFADGSKSMAHNLDDLRERWLLKQSEYNSLVDPYIQNKEIPRDYLRYRSIEEANEWQLKLLAEIQFIQRNLSALKGKIATLNRAGRSRDAAPLAVEREMLLAEIDYKRLARKLIRESAGFQTPAPTMEEYKEDKQRRWQRHIEQVGGEQELIDKAFRLLTGLTNPQKKSRRLSEEDRRVLRGLRSLLMVWGYTPVQGAPPECAAIDND